MFQRKVYRLETCVRPDVDAVSQMHALDDKGLCSLLKTANYRSWRFKGCHMILQMHRNSEMGVGIQNASACGASIGRVSIRHQETNGKII
jgi:hypothetical protein